MLTVQTQKDRTTAHVSLDTLETVSLVKIWTSVPLEHTTVILMPTARTRKDHFIAYV